MYASDLEPWSYFLTGEQRRAPEPYYDPLAFWTEEVHRRGIELHAWFNPYRAHHPKGGETSETSVVKKHPGLVKELENRGGADEIINQIMIVRGFLPQDPGHIHFSMKALLDDSSNIAESLLRGPYRTPALVPPCPWLDDQPPAAPRVNIEQQDDTLRVTWLHDQQEKVFRRVVYIRRGQRWEHRILAGHERLCKIRFLSPTTVSGHWMEKAG